MGNLGLESEEGAGYEAYLGGWVLELGLKAGRGVSVGVAGAGQRGVGGQASGIAGGRRPAGA
jgi:hypothetical protein